MSTASSNKAMLIDGKQAYASGGAVAQDGMLKVYYCGKCGSRVVWATSARTGGKYLVNVFDKHSGGMHYVKNQLHNAESCKREISETTATADEINAIAKKARRYAIMDAVGTDTFHTYQDVLRESHLSWEAGDAYLNTFAAALNLEEI